MPARDLFGVAVRTMGLWLVANAVATWVAAPMNIYGPAPSGIIGALLIARADTLVRLLYGKPVSAETF